MKFRLVLLLILIGLTPLLFIKPSTSPVCPDCNVVVIMLDTLRAQDLGCYGFALNTSPFIDRFASKSVLFENDFSQATITFPSHMSLFTSTYPSCSGFHTVGKDTLSPALTTLPQILKENGYRTLWDGILNDVQLSLTAGFERGIDKFIDRNISAGLDWVKSNPQKPFYMFYHTYTVHSPYTPSPESVRRLNPPLYDPRLYFNFTAQIYQVFGDMMGNTTLMNSLLSPEELKKYDQLTTISDYERFWQSLSNASSPIMSTLRKIFFSKLHEEYYSLFDLDKDLELLNVLYDAEIIEVDKEVEQVVDGLDNLGVLNNTIVIIAADHGEEFGEHGFTEHWAISDETTHVPLIVWIPGVRPSRRSEIVENLDISPTILRVLGIDVPAQMQGKGLFEGAKMLAFTELGKMQSVRADKWRWKHNPPGLTTMWGKHLPSYELYKVIDGNDVPDDVKQEYPEIAHRLNQSLQKWAAINTECDWGSNSSWWLKVDNATKERIIRTGYW